MESYKDYEDLLEQLKLLSEEVYRQFQSKLIPNITDILGVRLGKLRNIAKTIAKGNYELFFSQCDYKYFEVRMIYGMVIGYIKVDINKRIKIIEDFLPYIDNWSICDSFCSGLKFTNEYKEEMWEFITQLLNSSEEYTIRFAVVMMNFYYLDKERINKVLEYMNNISSEKYYVKMAVAWTVSIAYIKSPVDVKVFLHKCNLDNFTYDKSLRKILESKCITTEDREYIKGIARKSTV